MNDLKKLSSACWSRRPTRADKKLYRQALVSNATVSSLDLLSTARFLSVDPLDKDFANISPYVYASNDPINLQDYNGLYPQRPPTASHRAYLEKAGIEVYLQARARGYSVHGACFVLGLSANESAYNDKNCTAHKESIKYNNYFSAVVGVLHQQHRYTVNE